MLYYYYCIISCGVWVKWQVPCIYYMSYEILIGVCFLLFKHPFVVHSNEVSVANCVLHTIQFSLSTQSLATDQSLFNTPIFWSAYPTWQLGLVLPALLLIILPFLFFLQVWDIGGQPRFRSMWERYCRGVNCIVWVLTAL